MERLKLYISPCPNDTFMFDGWLNGALQGEEHPRVECSFFDIEELNDRLLRGEPEISKASFALLPEINHQYRLLDSGSALGRGNGQLLVRRKGETSPIRTVASPGLHTTANALLRRYFPEIEEVRQMLFSEIAEAVERGDVDAGVLIHEGRFVYERRNLELVADLGKLWEAETNLPLPLGAIIVKREIDVNIISLFDTLLSKSVKFAFDNPLLSRSFVKEHAQEMEDEVIDKHIALFVNDYTISLGEEGRKAVEKLLETQNL
jgi:1,4-dihydroxy-6-naphthoate synthase